MHQAWTSMRRRGLLCAVLTLLGCDGVIGVICAEDTAECSDSDAGADEEFDTSYLEFETSPEGELDLKWSLPWTCVGCDPKALNLFPGPDGSAWHVVAVDDRSWLERIDADQNKLAGPPAPLAPAMPLPTELRTSDGSGGVLLHRRSGSGSGALHEIEHVDARGMRRTVPLATGKRGAPMNVSLTPAGYLMHAKEGDPAALRLFDFAGQPLWSLERYPRPFLSGGSAISVGERFVASADKNPLNDDYRLGLLWISNKGTYDVYRTPRGVAWRATRFHRLSNEEILVVADSHVPMPLSTGDDAHDLDIVRFKGPLPEPNGVRLKQNCYHGVSNRGSTLDARGRLLISTITGQNQRDTHAMICRVSLAASASARCYGPPSRISTNEKQRVEPPLLDAIVAVGDNAVIAISEQKLLRVDLVEPGD